MKKLPTSILPITIMAADDHLLFLEGVASLLLGVADIQLVAKFCTGDTLLAAFCKQPTDVVLIDLSMPGIKTEALILALQQKSEQVKIIAVTMHCDAHRAHRLMEKGLHGYVLKDAAFDDLIPAIKTVCSNDIFISLVLKNEIGSLSDDELHSTMTEREQMVITQVAEGLSNKEVARALDITERTVRFHLANCCTKLGATSRTEAVTIAYSRKLISL